MDSFCSLEVQDADGLQIKNGKIIYSPLPEEPTLSVSASIQKRNILAVRLNRQAKRATVIGPIATHYAFRELFDFSAGADSTVAGELKDALQTFDASSIERLLTSIFSAPADAPLPPIQFSQNSFPFTQKDLRPSLKTKQDNRNRRAEGRRFASASFSDQSVPQEPIPELLVKVKNIPTDQLEVVKRLFEERPIMSKQYIQFRLKDRPEIIANLRLILPVIGYSWRNGPWFYLWTRYGLDPRLDPEYRKFQTVDASLRVFSDRIKRGRNLSQLPASESQKLNVFKASNYTFDGQELVLDKLFYQACDLTYAPLKDILSDPSNYTSRLSERDGWYREGTIRTLVRLIKSRLFELLKITNLSGLSPAQQEDIYRAFVPDRSTNALSLPANLSQLLQQEELQPDESDTVELRESENEFSDQEEAEDESDYEIFD